MSIENINFSVIPRSRFSFPIFVFEYQWLTAMSAKFCIVVEIPKSCWKRNKKKREGLLIH